MNFLTRREQLWLAAFVLLFLGLAFLSARTKRPWSDEGWFASTGFTLAEKGYMGTPVLDETGSFTLPGIKQYTYWVLPFYFIVQAAWYKVLGFGMMQMRLLAAVEGLVVLACWFVILWRLTGDKRISLVALALIASDYYFVQMGSFGRYDMQNLMFGSLGLATYLTLRERNLPLAIFLANCFLTAGGLTHFLGIMLFVAFLITFMMLDRKRLSFSLLLLAAVPYVVGGALWGQYILRDPELWKKQFFSTATNDGRVSSILNLGSAIQKEIYGRYVIGFGLGSHAAGSSPIVALKSLVLAAWLLAVGLCLAIGEVRRMTAVRLLLLFILCDSLFLLLLDGHRQTWYIVHLVPLYSSLCAIVGVWLWDHRPALRKLLVPAFAGIILLQAGGSAVRVRQNVYGKRFLPVAHYINDHAAQDELVMGSAELGFGIGFDRNFIDDVELGFRTGRIPRYIVFEENWNGVLEAFASERPDVYRYVHDQLSNKYDVVYDAEGYRIYKLRSGA
jgi:hypothetical protein